MSPIVVRSTVRLWSGRIMSGAAALFLLFDSVIKLLYLAPVVEAFARLGWPLTIVRGIGALELLCLVVYVIPRSAPLGAVLLTGFLGGAVAIHLRVGDPLFSHVRFPTYVALLVWGGYSLRDPRLLALLVNGATPRFIERTWTVRRWLDGGAEPNLR